MLIVSENAGSEDRVVRLDGGGSIVYISVGDYYVASIVQDEGSGKIHIDLPLGVEDPLIQMNGEYIKVTKGET